MVLISGRGWWWVGVVVDGGSVVGRGRLRETAGIGSGDMAVGGGGAGAGEGCWLVGNWDGSRKKDVCEWVLMWECSLLY